MDENLIKERIKKYGEDLKMMNEKIPNLRNQLAQAIDQAKIIQGAILGLQDLLKEKPNEEKPGDDS